MTFHNSHRSERLCLLHPQAVCKAVLATSWLSVIEGDDFELGHMVTMKLQLVNSVWYCQLLRTHCTTSFTEPLLGSEDFGQETGTASYCPVLNNPPLGFQVLYPFRVWRSSVGQYKPIVGIWKTESSQTWEDEAALSLDTLIGDLPQDQDARYSEGLQGKSALEASMPGDTLRTWIQMATEWLIKEKHP